MSRVVLLLAAALALGCRVSGGPADDKTPPKPEADDKGLKLSDDEQAVIDATNAERKAAKLDPLTADAKLTAAARAHAPNMAKQDKLAHELDDKGIGDRAKDAGYEFRRLGENIAWNQPTPKKVVAAWMGSKGHKENLLNGQFTQIGVAVVKNGKGEPYWVQVFGTPK